MTSKDVLELLEQKYPVEKFLTVPECKIGSTWFSPMCFRLDLWAMSRSWRNPRFIGCEIKVTRQDFLNDNKWQNYLPYCTEFYFVAAPGVVYNISEIPEQAGFMEATKNCKRLIVRKKAPVRDVEIPQSLLIYILMCRTRIVSDNTVSKADIWKDRLEEMKANKRLGADIAWHIRHLANKKVKRIIEENKKLKEENRLLEGVRECLCQLNISEKDLRAGGAYRLKHTLQEAISGVPFDLLTFLRLKF